MEKKKKIQITLSKKTFEILEKKSAQKGISKSAFISILINNEGEKNA